MPLNTNKIRADFPFFGQSNPPVYLDNASATQKPACVLSAMEEVYTSACANVRRGNYSLARSAQNIFESARDTVCKFIGAESRSEIIFTSGATDSVNKLASAICRNRLTAGSNIVLTAMEHHSNFIPWQEQCRIHGAQLRIVPVLHDGTPDIRQWEQLIDCNTVIAAVSGMSNVTGCTPPLEQMIQTAHSKNVPVLVDAAQLAAHRQINVKALDCDFLVFSSHKLYGPFGVGVLYGKKELLAALPLPSFGGGMVELVNTDEENTYTQLPHSWESGTPDIAGAAGLACALDYLSDIGFPDIEKHERALAENAWNALSDIKGIKLYGAPSPVISFNIEGISSYDAGVFLDLNSVSVRSSSHCAQPLMRALGTSVTVRVSLGIYSTYEDIAALKHAAERLCRYPYG